MANTPKHCPPTNLEEITRQLTAFGGTEGCPPCDNMAAPYIGDVAHVFHTINRLCHELKAARLENANLRAAFRAALGAAADGETDPLDYLRWELPEDSGGWCV